MNAGRRKWGCGDCLRQDARRGEMRYDQAMQISDRIVATADTCSGHPRVAGTRIRVAHVLGWLAAGMSEAEISQDYPELTTDDIRASISFRLA